MCKIIFVRHGEADGNVERFFHGHFNSNLTLNGHHQARLTAKYLLKYNIDVLYSSDLRRTLDTASYIAKAKGLDIIPVQELREIYGGKWENIEWEELPKKYPTEYNHWLNLPHLLNMPDGESMHEFQNRISTAIIKILSENKNKDVCIVTHGTAIKAMLCLWSGVGLDHLPSMPWYDNASITVLEYQGDEYKLILEGENSHLGELSTLAKQDWWRK